MEKSFPRTNVGGISVPRMIIGTNWILGFSHKSMAASKHIREVNSTAEAVAAQFETYLKYDINAVIGPMVGPLVSRGGDGLVGGGQANVIVDAAKIAEEKFGKEIILIPTTDLNTDDNAEGRKMAQAQVKAAKDIGAKICYISFSTIDQLLNYKERKINRLSDYTYMVREAGMIPMIGNHSYQIIPFADDNNEDVETYLCVYNSAGFYMHAEVEDVYRTIQNAKKPVLTIKAMAAGRLTPFVGLNFSYSTIRDIDMVAVGAMTPAEAEEDIEISMAAIEHRPVESLVKPMFAWAPPREEKK
jgi:hypothetical protein